MPGRNTVFFVHRLIPETGLAVETPIGLKFRPLCKMINWTGRFQVVFVGNNRGPRKVNLIRPPHQTGISESKTCG